MGVVIDLKDELRLRHLANELGKDLGLEAAHVDEMGGPVEIAVNLLQTFDGLPVDAETMEEDHPELFKLLRRMVG